MRETFIFHLSKPPGLRAYGMDLTRKRSSPESERERIVIIDTETTGLPARPSPPPDQSESWNHCRLVQFAWAIYDTSGYCLQRDCFTIYPEGFRVPIEAAAIHGISNDEAMKDGSLCSNVLTLFYNDLIEYGVSIVVAHNIRFDDAVIQAELWRAIKKGVCDSSFLNRFLSLERRCTMITGTLRGQRWPRLADLYIRYFGGETPTGCHRADIDVDLCSKIYFAMVKEGLCFRS